MFRKTLLTVGALSALFANHLFAQTPDSEGLMSGEPAEVTLVRERVSFVKAFYPLSADQTARLEKELGGRIDANREYMKRNELMIRRRTTAIAAVLPQDRNMPVEKLESLRTQYQDEIYRLREAAPLSLTSAVQMAEDMLDADARKTGRKKIEAYFSKQLKGASIDPAHMDRLILEPVPMLDITQNEGINITQDKLMGTQASDHTTPEKLAADRPSVKELAEARAAAMKAKTEAAKRALSAGHEGHDHGEEPPAASNRALLKADLDAPPLAEWEGAYQTWATNYEFTAEQKSAAEAIYNSCMTQAEARKKSVDTDLEKARAMTDGPERERAIAIAKQPLDSIFSQMKMRIDSVASIEQRERYKSTEAKSDKPADAKG